VLSDAAKRASYDRFGAADSAGFSADDASQMFDGFMAGACTRSLLSST